MVVYEAAGNDVKVTVNGVDAKGKSTHNEWTGNFDGKNYPVTGDPTSEARSYKKIDDRTLELTVWHHGRIMTTGRVVVSADGKSRTVTTNGTDAKGKRSRTRRCTTSSNNISSRTQVRRSTEIRRTGLKRLGLVNPANPV